MHDCMCLFTKSSRVCVHMLVTPLHSRLLRVTTAALAKDHSWSLMVGSLLSMQDC